MAYEFKVAERGWKPSRHVRLTRKVGDNQAPARSPDGRRSVFAGEPSFGWQSNVYVMNADGSGVKRLTSRSQGDLEPTWQRLVSRAR